MSDAVARPARSDTDVGYFADLYGRDPDPWGFDRRWYERRKYELTVASLPQPHYRRGVEPGCANGSLTRRLAPRCDQLFAFDHVPIVVERARQRLSHLSNVTVLEARFPDFWPAGTGDLVVWSEIAYYLAEESAARAMVGLERWLEPGGTLVSVHYTGATDYPRTGAEIASWVEDCGFLDRRASLRDEQFELVVWQRRSR